MTKRATCFWLSSAGILWVLAGYPAALALLPRRRWRQEDVEPSIAIVVPAFREREELRAKLGSIGRLDYPGDRVHVVVAVDEDPEVARVAHEALAHRERPLLRATPRKGREHEQRRRGRSR